MYKRANLDEDTVVLINKEHVAAETRMTHSLEPRTGEFPWEHNSVPAKDKKKWCLVCVSLLRNVLAGKFTL